MNPPKDLKTPTTSWGFLFDFENTAIFRIFNYMKKYQLFLAISVTLMMMACGSESTTNEVKDSTVVVDSVVAPVVDSSANVGGSGEQTPSNEVVK